MDAWTVDELPGEADEADIEAAEEALVDEGETDADMVLAYVADVSPRSVRRWRSEGCDGTAAKLIHVIRLLDGQEVRD